MNINTFSFLPRVRYAQSMRRTAITTMLSLGFVKWKKCLNSGRRVPLGLLRYNLSRPRISLQLHLFEIVDGYDMVYKWFDVLKKNGWQVIGFTTMPNHAHVILYFPKPGYDLNKIISNVKRFMAYEIIKRLEKMKRNDLLEYLFEAVTKKEKKKAQRNRVFQ